MSSVPFLRQTLLIFLKLTVLPDTPQLRIVAIVIGIVIDCAFVHSAHWPLASANRNANTNAKKIKEDRKKTNIQIDVLLFRLSPSY